MKAIFLDIETTGLDTRRHKPIDIGFKIIDVTTGAEIAAYQSIIKITEEEWNMRDLASVQINGFTWDKVQTGKLASIVSQEIIEIFKNAGVERLKAAFICQNPSFDRGFFTQLIDVYIQENLNWPYHWLDFASMYWALLSKQNADEGVPFPEELNLSKNEIAKRHDLPKEAEPHEALGGVDHLITCYKAVVGIKSFNPTPT